LLAKADLLFDFGLFVLIWVVQLIIYPSFKTKPEETFVQWHSNYSRRISYVVIPLMLGQVICTAVLLFRNTSSINLLSAALVAGAWLSTFFLAVPLHRKFASGVYEQSDFNRLCRRNWIRTIIWTAIFFLNFAVNGNFGSI